MTAEKRGAYGPENILSRARVPLYLDKGEVRGAPQEYFDFWKPNPDGSFPEHLQRFIEAGTRYPESDMTAPAERYLREWFGINPENKDVRMFLSASGSEGILERIPRLLFSLSDKTILYGVGPHFPEIVRFIDQLPRTRDKYVRYVPIQSDIYEPAGDVIEKTIKQVKGFKKSRYGKDVQVAVYGCNPGTPKGDVASKDSLISLSRAVHDVGGYTFLDEAFSTFRGSESMMCLIEELQGLSVFGSESKVDGLAGWRFGYMGSATKKIVGSYRSLVNPYDIGGPQAVLMNYLFDSGILLSHRERKKQIIISRKTKLMKEMDRLEIRYPETDPATSIMLADCGTDTDLYKALTDLSVATAPGTGFGVTHNAFKLGRFVRLAVPEEEDAPDLANRLKWAIDAATRGNPITPGRFPTDEPLGISPRDSRNMLE